MSQKHTLQQAYMTVSMAHLLRKGETVFHGVASPLPMLATLFAQKTHAPNLTYLNISGSVNPRPSHLPVSTVDPQLLKMTSSLFPVSEAFDLAAKGRLDSVFLSGIQIDRTGNLNMSTVGSNTQSNIRLPGGAGSAFLAKHAGRVLLWRTKHNPRSLVEELSFITAAPARDVYLITPLCVFHREESELVVSSIHPFSSEAEICKNTGWNVRFSNALKNTPPLTDSDWQLLAKLAPRQSVAIEF